jgi:hypothetical protein
VDESSKLFELSDGIECGCLPQRGDYIIGFSGFLGIIDDTFVELMATYHEWRRVRNI